MYIAYEAKLSITATLHACHLVVFQGCFGATMQAGMFYSKGPSSR